MCAGYLELERISNATPNHLFSLLPDRCHHDDFRLLVLVKVNRSLSLVHPQVGGRIEPEAVFYRIDSATPKGVRDDTCFVLCPGLYYRGSVLVRTLDAALQS